MSDKDNTALVEAPAKPVDVVRGALERMKPQLALALPKHLTPERLVRIAMTAIQRTPKLLDCDRTSFYGAVMMAAQLGLEPDGVLGQAYLIPFAGKVQFIPGYKGLLTLARNSGEISYIAAHEIRENDTFDFDFASGDPPVHKFSLKEDRGEVIGFYAIARFRDGSFHWDMMTFAEVVDIRDNSSGYQAAKRYSKNGKIDSPWTDHFVEMGKKTAIRRLAKYLPLSVQKAAEIDAAVNAGMHVSLDRYGDIVIEGEAKQVEEESEMAGVGARSKLDRFEEKHGASAIDKDDNVVPRGTKTTEVRGDAPAADNPGPDASASTPSEAAASAQGDMLTPEAGAAARKEPVIPDPANASGERDIKFWGRKDGSLKLLATDPDAFMGELQIRMAECRTWAETEDVERANAAFLRRLSADDRMEAAGMVNRRREELR